MGTQRLRRSITRKQSMELAFDIESFQVFHVLSRSDLLERLGIGSGTLGRIRQGRRVDKVTAARVRKAIDGNWRPRGN